MFGESWRRSPLLGNGILDNFRTIQRTRLIDFTRSARSDYSSDTP
jgi:hypothetical protein